MTKEGVVNVEGAGLSYRLAGTATGLPVIVLENGWSASYDMWAWVERELAPHTQLLMYNRSGTGGSTLPAPQTAAGISAQLAGLLDALEITRPVVVVGQSYGGLMCAVHAARIPSRLRAIVQVDSSPDFEDEVIDAQFKLMQKVGAFVTLLARLGIPDPLLHRAAATLPPEAAVRLRTVAFGSAESMRNACDELALLPQLRALAATETPVQRLVISADSIAANKNWFMKLLAPEARFRALLARMQALHQRQARRGMDSRWAALPYNHGDLVFTEAGARATSVLLLNFLRSLSN